MTTDPVEGARELLQQVRETPEDVEPDAFEPFLHSDDLTARRYGLTGLKLLARRDPAVAAQWQERVLELLADPAEEVRAGALDLLTTAFDDETIAANVPAIAELLDDEYAVVGQRAIEALVRAAQADPGACRPHVEKVTGFLDADPTQEEAVKFLGLVAEAHPAAVVTATDRLVEILLETEYDQVALDPSVKRRGPEAAARVEDDQQAVFGRHRRIRQLAGHAVEQVATVRPDLVAPELGAVAGLLDSHDPQIRHVAVDILTATADAEPQLVAGFAVPVAARLDDDAAFVRASACTFLGTVALAVPATVRAAVVDRINRVQPLLDHDDPPIQASATLLVALVAERRPDAVPETDDGALPLNGEAIRLLREVSVDAFDEQSR